MRARRSEPRSSVKSTLYSRNLYLIICLRNSRISPYLLSMPDVRPLFSDLAVTTGRGVHINGTSRAFSSGKVAFIFMLPFELLSIIFEIVAESEPPCSPVTDIERNSVQKKSDPCMRKRLWDDAVQGGSLGWIRLCHVCCTWRSYICEEMPLLWARHIGCFRSPDALEEMLQRAGQNTCLSIRIISNSSTTDYSRLGTAPVQELGLFNGFDRNTGNITHLPHALSDCLD